MDHKYIKLNACKEFTRKLKTKRDTLIFICGIGFSAKMIQYCAKTRFYLKNKWHPYIFHILSVLRCISCPSKRDCLAYEWCLARSPWGSFSPCVNWNWLSLLTEKHHHNVNVVCSHCCDSKWVVGMEFNLLAKRFWTVENDRFLAVLNGRQMPWMLNSVCWN